LKNKELNIGFLYLGKFTSDFYKKEIEQLSIKNNRSYKLIEIEVNFNEWNEHLPYGFDELEPKLKKALLKLNSKEVDVIVIPNITLHFTLDRLNLPPELSNKIIHPITGIIDYLIENRIKEITLIGTRYTMNSKIMNEYFTKFGIELNKLNSKSIKQIDNLRSEIFENGYSEGIDVKMKTIIESLTNPILACTELSILNIKNEYLDLSRKQLAKCFI